MRRTGASVLDGRGGGHRIALVLGSGGVRSIAAIGMVEVMRRANIFPDLIVGCGSGALIGAAIACGMNMHDAVHTATSLWSSDLEGQRRWRAYPQMVIPRLAGFGAEFSLRDDRLSTRRMREAFGDAKLECLSIPMRIAATDAATGDSVILSRGSLVDSLRASLAVPLLFPSVVMERRRLVDGSISDPTPVRAASDAEVIVALGFERDLPTQVDTPTRLVARASAAAINNLQSARLEAARASGLGLVRVDLTLERRVGPWETSAMPEIYEAGQRAMARAMPMLHAHLNSAARARAA